MPDKGISKKPSLLYKHRLLCARILPLNWKRGGGRGLWNQGANYWDWEEEKTKRKKYCSTELSPSHFFESQNRSSSGVLSKQTRRCRQRQTADATRYFHHRPIIQKTTPSISPLPFPIYPSLFRDDRRRISPRGGSSPPLPSLPGSGEK